MAEHITRIPPTSPRRNELPEGFSIEALVASERDAECESCGQRIFRSRTGGFSHYGNTTASPETCYSNGSMTSGRPAGYEFDYVTRTWHHPAMRARRIGG